MQSAVKTRRTCPLCKKAAQSSMAGLSEYWYCPDCRLGWIKTIPPTTYGSEYYTSGSSLIARLFMPIERYFYAVRALYTGIKKKTTWIDVGAGDGNFLSTVKADKKIGVEVSASGRKVMKEKGLGVMTNEAFLQKKHLQAAVISFWQVLEHVQDPVAYVTASANNLQQRGTLVVAVPNCDSFELRMFGRYWFHLAPRYHIWHFSPRAMRRLLTDNGFRVRSVDYFAIEHHLTGIVQSYINRTTRTQDILHKLVKRRQQSAAIPLQARLWIIFWCTLGLPVVFLTWIIASVARRSGTFVMVAERR